MFIFNRSIERSLFINLSSFNWDSSDFLTIQKVVEYLANHPNLPLQNALSQKIAHGSADQVSQCLRELTAYSFSTKQLQMLDVCQRVVDIKKFQALTGVQDVTSLAKSEADIVPKPKRSIDEISQSLSQRWVRHAGIFTKAVQYIVQTVTWTYSIDLDRPPDSYWTAQSQWMFFRSLSQDFVAVGTTFITLFSTTWKMVIAVAGVFMSILGFSFIYHRFKLNSPISFDSSKFRNLTIEAKAGQLQPTVGREEEMRLLESFLSSFPGQKPLIPILIGPPGVGKSQIVEGLATKIANGECPFLKDKKVVSVNTAYFSEMGQFSERGYSSRLDGLLQKIEGHEDEVIIFFDEAQNGATTNDSRSLGKPPLLEILKTVLLEKNIHCIFASTEDEFNLHIAPNAPFVERTREIILSSLDARSTKTFLQRKVLFNRLNVVKVDLNAIDEILNVAGKNPKYQNRANPRKSDQLLQEVMSFVYSWKPEKLSKELTKQEQKCKEHKASCLQNRNQPGWAFTETGKRDIQKLQQLNADLNRIQAKKKEENNQFEKITYLRHLMPRYFERECEVIHLLSDRKAGEEAEKTYLFMQYYVLPILHAQIDREVDAFNKSFGEAIPLKVDTKLVQRLFK